MGWGAELCTSKLRYFQNFRKIGKWTKSCHSQSVKKQLCSWLFQRKLTLFQRKSALFQGWILALKIFVFSAVQRFSGNEQRWNRPEIVLNQSWSALNVSETSTRVVHIYFDHQKTIIKGNLEHSRVGKTWLPHHDFAMIIPWWRPCFLAWSSQFMAWLWYDYHVFHDSYLYHDHHVFWGKMDCISMFSQTVAGIIWQTYWL